jgi:hypothetical protein
LVTFGCEEGKKCEPELFDDELLLLLLLLDLPLLPLLPELLDLPLLPLLLELLPPLDLPPPPLE